MCSYIDAEILPMLLYLAEHWYRRVATILRIERLVKKIGLGWLSLNMQVWLSITR